jgi:aspartyl/asparaginyl-tRNA synthetase
MCRKVIEKGEREIAFLEKFYKRTSVKEIRSLAEKSFVHISYSDAIKELEKASQNTNGI